MGKKRKRVDLSQVAGESFTFGDLLKAKGVEIPRSELPTNELAHPAIADKDAKANLSSSWRFGSNIRLKRERKGRGGKTVTLIEGLELPADELSLLAKSVRKAMGSGAKVEGENIVVQGDIGERLMPWLEAEGAPRVRCV